MSANSASVVTMLGTLCIDRASYVSHAGASEQHEGEDMKTRVVLALALVLALGLPVSAQTGYSEFVSKLSSWGDVWGEPLSPAAIKASAERAEAFLLPVLLSTDPDDCYVAGYVGMWRVYAAVAELAETETSDAAFEAYLGMLIANVTSSGDALREATCVGSE